KNISPGTAASLPPRAAPLSPTNSLKTATASNTSPTVTPTNKPVAVAVTRLPDEIKITPAHDVTPAAESPASVSRAVQTPSNPPPAALAQTSTQTSKRGLFQRLNPFRKRPKTEATPAAIEEKFPTPIVLVPSNPSPTIATAARPVLLPPPPISRYNYQSPSKPAPGNRRDAERYLVQGLKAHRDGRRVDAIAAYRTAILADPSYFEAHYNLGLAAYDAGHWTVSLNA